MIFCLFSIAQVSISLFLFVMAFLFLLEGLYLGNECPNVLSVVCSIYLCIWYIKSALCVRAKSLQLCPTLCDPINYSPPGSSDHGILQTRIVKWVTMPSSRGSSRPRNQTLYLLHFLYWQVDSLPLMPPGKLKSSLNIYKRVWMERVREGGRKERMEREKKERKNQKALVR